MLTGGYYAETRLLPVLRPAETQQDRAPRTLEAGFQCTLTATTAPRSHDPNPRLSDAGAGLRIAECRSQAGFASWRGPSRTTQIHAVSSIPSSSPERDWSANGAIRFTS